jgi:hypothetical protein
MFILNRTVFAPYSVRIRYQSTPIPYLYPHTIRSDSESEKHMVMNTVLLLSIRIRSVFTPIGVGVACLVHVLLQLLFPITSCLEICIDMPKAISLWATRKNLIDCIQ